VPDGLALAVGDAVVAPFGAMAQLRNISDQRS